MRDGEFVIEPDRGARHVTIFRSAKAAPRQCHVIDPSLLYRYVVVFRVKHRMSM
jgi:hypothetical protein